MSTVYLFLDRLPFLKGMWNPNSYELSDQSCLTGWEKVYYPFYRTCLEYHDKNSFDTDVYAMSLHYVSGEEEFSFCSNIQMKEEICYTSFQTSPSSF